jgi:hypothetical protein
MRLSRRFSFVPINQPINSEIEIRSDHADLFGAFESRNLQRFQRYVLTVLVGDKYRHEP